MVISCCIRFQIGAAGKAGFQSKSEGQGSAMPKSSSKRILETPSAYARRHYYYVQEIGTLQSLEPHISSRQGLHSFLFFVVLSGSGRTRIGSQSRSIGAGDCVWIDCSGEYAHESSAEDPGVFSGFTTTARRPPHPTPPSCPRDIRRSSIRAVSPPSRSRSRPCSVCTAARVP